MISAVIILSFLIFFHELGHFLMARLVGVKVEVFSIGFGKKLICKKFGDTNWCLSAIPLGGYVQMKGQDDTNPNLKNNDPDSYNSKTPWQRILILLGGPGFNFLLAFLIYLFIAFTGWTKLAPVIGKTIPNTPAAKVLKPGDKIVKINGVEIKSWDEISPLIQKYDVLHLTVERNKRYLSVDLKPKIELQKNIFGEEIKRKIVGIIPSGDVIKVHYSPVEAVKIAWDKFVFDSMLIIKGVQKLITGAVGLNTLSGPIGIVDITAKVADYGWQPLLLLAALLSVNLGVLNLLPIPALDGGHIMFNLYEAIFKREVSEEIMVKLTIGGWIILGSLMLIGIYNDLHRLIGG
ncbi:putative membrane-associated zinc metalloprotease [Nautilia profundicola AmH]|uniref:Zinc metalloprotease n=1 Tax=Nautilia profundicola (strain ATCC BAA-1463 / DSM 18972 / AmH) TaxID=598659 RepID=B9L9Q4_NAUPA|nr:RIP metalloprotease RseP [Nautilia profundicola]ACM92848.1 putative membrane-associated zinc metalloprotease [Nautilia profundicola AmH]